MTGINLLNLTKTSFTKLSSTKESKDINKDQKGTIFIEVGDVNVYLYLSLSVFVILWIVYTIWYLLLTRKIIRARRMKKMT